MLSLWRGWAFGLNPMYAKRCPRAFPWWHWSPPSFLMVRHKFGSLSWISWTCGDWILPRGALCCFCRGQSSFEDWRAYKWKWSSPGISEALWWMLWAFCSKVLYFHSEGVLLTYFFSTLDAGMPYPQNLSTAKEVESVVKQHGATPATIAILNGVPCIGTSFAGLHEYKLLSNFKYQRHWTLTFSIVYSDGSKFSSGSYHLWVSAQVWLRKSWNFWRNADQQLQRLLGEILRKW